MGELKVIIGDGCLATWMPINNTFRARTSENWHTATDYWEGVLIQPGQYQVVKQHTTKGPAEVGAVLLKDAAGKTLDTIEGKDLQERNVWINVVASKDPEIAGMKDPVSKSDQDYIFPTGVGQQAMAKPLPRRFTPMNSGITIWQDSRYGFDLEARQDSNEGSHNKYTFTFATGGAFSVEIFNHPSAAGGVKRFPAGEAEGGKAVASIEIEERSKKEGEQPGHGDGNNPPDKP